jgi:lipopolysaccharide/colanic/teichoic acid biosynthesis glycosyltransferase
MRAIQLGIKRVFDVIVCSAILLIAFPLFILLALLVRISSPGPILFIQERLGKHGRPFRMMKFRTMRYRPQEAQSTVWTADDEASITTVGRFLRDYGLDELPQVVNIIRGDMSVVGPRPGLPSQIESYGGTSSAVFRMRPGVISLAAVQGRRAIPMSDRIALHREYVERWSLALDFSILWKALFVVLRRENAGEAAVADRK